MLHMTHQIYSAHSLFLIFFLISRLHIGIDKCQHYLNCPAWVKHYLENGIHKDRLSLISAKWSASISCFDTFNINHTALHLDSTVKYCFGWKMANVILGLVILSNFKAMKVVSFREPNASYTDVMKNTWHYENFQSNIWASIMSFSHIPLNLADITMLYFHHMWWLLHYSVLPGSHYALFIH